MGCTKNDARYGKSICFWCGLLMLSCGWEKFGSNSNGFVLFGVECEDVVKGFAKRGYWWGHVLQGRL